MRVGQEVDAAILHQRGRVTDPGHARHVGRRCNQVEVGRAGDRADLLGGRPRRVALAHPHEKVAEERTLLVADEHTVAVMRFRRVGTNLGIGDATREQRAEGRDDECAAGVSRRKVVHQ